MMIDWTAEHVGFVLGAYTCVAVVLGGIAIRTLLHSRALKQDLAALKIADVGKKETE
jgi:hypothetical protein